jgi:rubredoxin
MAKYECRICGYVFDEQQAGESFDNVYSCPICDADKEGFKLIDGEEADTDSKIDDSTSEDDDDFFFEEADGTIEKSGDVVADSEASTDNAAEKSESTDDASNADAEKEEIPESTSAFNSFADFLKSKEENKDEYKPSETKDFIDEVLESSDSLMTEEKEEEKAEEAIEETVFEETKEKTEEATEEKAEETAEETTEPVAQEVAEEKVEEPAEEKEEPVEEKKEETPVIEFDNIFTKMDPVKEEDKVEETTEFSFEEAVEEKAEETVEEKVEEAVEEVKEEVTETTEEVKEEVAEEAKEEAPTEFVIEKRQEFWKKEDDTAKEEETEEEKSPVILNRMGSVEKVIGEGADDTEAPRESEYRRDEEGNDMIQTFYTGAPVKTEEQIKAEEEAKNKENQDFVPLWSGNGMGTVQKVVGEPKKEENPDDSEELIFEEENIDVKADEAKTEPEVTESAPDEDGVVYLNFGNEEKEEAEDTTKVVEDAVNEDASTEEDFFISEEDVQDENSVSYFVEEENDIKPEEPVVEETAETPVEEAVEETTETTEATEEAAEATEEETTEAATEETVEAAEAIDERDYICLDEDADVVDGKPVAYSMLKADMKYTVLYDLAAKKIFDDYPLRDANVSNGLENIILLPAQCNPLPLKRSATVETKTMIGALTDCPVEVLQPFCFSKLFLWGEHIPNNPRPETYANQALVLVKGEDGHIPNLSSKEELREEVAIAKERFNHTPVGIDLVAGRIEADLEACVYAKLDFVILNDVSSRILPYALRRARNYLNRVNSKLEILVCVEALKDAQELAKILALGANFVLVERGFDLDMANKMTEALKEICRSTGHSNVHDLSLDDICTIDTDLAMYTDIRHV